MRRPANRTIVGGVLVAMVCVILGLTAFIVSDRLARVPGNTAAIKAIQEDRARRIVDACATRHAAYLAIVANLDLINDLLHQTDPNDLRIPPNLRSLVRENLAKADARVADARAVAAQADCLAPIPALKTG